MYQNTFLVFLTTQNKFLQQIYKNESATNMKNKNTT